MYFSPRIFALYLDDPIRFSYTLLSTWNIITASKPEDFCPCLRFVSVPTVYSGCIIFGGLPASIAFQTSQPLNRRRAPQYQISFHFSFRCFSILVFMCLWTFFSPLGVTLPSRVTSFISAETSTSGNRKISRIVYKIGALSR